MLHFENLNILKKHFNYLNKKIKNKNLFFVGGCIRDLLLDIEKNPNDIDLALAGKPEKIYKNLEKANISHFMTEKFGTITLIKKEKTKKSESNGFLHTKYEITPFRTEAEYEDCRHPEKIHRSNDILLDSNRRDFTINCMYYTTQKTKIPISNNKETILLKKENLINLLEKNGFIYLQNINLYIIQNQDYIKKLFKNGEFQSDFLQYLINIAPPINYNIETSIHNNILNSNKSKNQKSTTSKSGDIGFIIDPHKGIQDLIYKKIQTVGNPDKRFNEDALRIIRAIRFPNILNIKLKKYYNTYSIKSNDFFDYEKETRNSLKRNAHLIKKVAKERIKDELRKIFSNDNPFGCIALLDEIKILEYIFPSLYETKHIDQPTRYHPFDIYTHSLLALYEIQKINTDPLVKFAVLYHDVGKVKQYNAYKDYLSKEEIKEILSGPLNHRKSGPELVKKDFQKLGFSKKEIDDIARYVAQHHRPEEFLGAKDENKTKKLRKFLSEAGYKKVLNILDICIADRMGQYNPLQSTNDVSDVYEAIGQLNLLHELEGQFTLKNLAINGNDIMRKFHLNPGPDIGKYLKKSFERVLENIDKKNNKKAILHYLSKIIKK